MYLKGFNFNKIGPFFSVEIKYYGKFSTNSV